MTSLIDLINNIISLSDEQFAEYKREILSIECTNPNAYNIGMSLICIRDKCA